jgi:hypothetical protein
MRPGFALDVSPSENRGRRECRALDAPAASRAVVKLKHTSIVTTVTPVSPGIPRAMVLRLPSCSPRRAKPVSHRRHRHWVSGPHDFSVRASAPVLRTARVHRIPLATSVTIAKRPSCESGTAGDIDRVATSENQNIFARGLDKRRSTAELICPSGKSPRHSTRHPA